VRAHLLQSNLGTARKLTDFTKNKVSGLAGAVQPVLQAGFGTATLDLAHWGVAIAMASSVLWFDELRKLVLRIVLHR
jgi:hypothetical protein